jgi:hypothetical protein
MQKKKGWRRKHLHATSPAKGKVKHSLQAQTRQIVRIDINSPARLSSLRPGRVFVQAIELAAIRQRPMRVNSQGLGLYAEDLSRPVHHSPKVAS